MKYTLVLILMMISLATMAQSISSPGGSAVDYGPIDTDVIDSLITVYLTVNPPEVYDTTAGLAYVKALIGGKYGPSDTTAMFAYIKSRIAAVNGMISDSLVARSNDYATPTHTHTGVYLAIADSAGNFKRPDTAWALTYVKSLITAKVSYSDSNSWLPTWADINAKNYLTAETGDISNVSITAPITGGGSSGSVTIGWDSTALNYSKSLISVKVSASDSATWLPTWADINAKNYLTAETGDISNVSVTAPITGGGASGSVTIGWDSTALNYVKLLQSRHDSTVIILPILDSSWIAANGTNRHLPVMLMHKWFTVDSMMVAVVGTASTDTIAVDVRWSNDYSTGSGGTALQTTPTNCPASTTGTRIGSFTNANIPKFHWLWMRLTKEVGTAKSISVTLKGRWR